MESENQSNKDYYFFFVGVIVIIFDNVNSSELPFDYDSSSSSSLCVLYNTSYNTFITQNLFSNSLSDFSHLRGLFII